MTLQSSRQIARAGKAGAAVPLHCATCSLGKAPVIHASGGDFASAGDEGFRRLFGYISGRNSSQSKTSMTTPVAQEAQSEKISMTLPVKQSGSPTAWRIAFMLPGKYKLDSAPGPGDTRIAPKLSAGRGREASWLTCCHCAGDRCAEISRIVRLAILPILIGC